MKRSTTECLQASLVSWTKRACMRVLSYPTQISYFQPLINKNRNLQPLLGERRTKTLPKSEQLTKTWSSLLLPNICCWATSTSIISRLLRRVLWWLSTRCYRMVANMFTSIHSPSLTPISLPWHISNDKFVRNNKCIINLNKTGNINDRSCWINYFFRSFLSTLHHIPPFKVLHCQSHHPSAIVRDFKRKKEKKTCAKMQFMVRRSSEANSYISSTWIR